MTRHSQRLIPSASKGPGLFENILLLACLCILALRTTYTEAPVAQTGTPGGGLGDTVYSLTVSGLLIFAFGLWLLKRVFTGRLVYRVTGLEIGLALFAVAAVLSSYGASDKRTAITQVVTLLGPIFAALLLAQILDHLRKIRLVLAVVVALGIVSAYQAAEQFFLSNPITIEEYQKNPEALLRPLGIEPGTFQQFLFEHRLYGADIRGFFTTSNSAASFAILASAAAAALLAGRWRNRRVRETGSRHELLGVLAMALVIGGLLLTHSKGGILAFLAGALLAGLLVGIDRRLPSQKRRILTALAILILLCLVTGGYAIVQYGLRHHRLPGGNSMLVRWQYWEASARMVADHRLTGVGPGNFSDYYPQYKPAAALETVADPHNLFLSLLTQYGPLGLLGFVAMVLVPLWRSLATPEKMDEEPGQARADGSGGGIGTEGLGNESRHSQSAPRPQPSFRTLVLMALFAISVSLLAVRLMLLPRASDSPDILLYELVTVHAAPIAAFLIGLLLAASPLDEQGQNRAGPAEAILPAILGSAVLAVLLHNLVDFALFEPGVWMAFWVVVACLIAPRVQRQPGFSIAIGRPRIARPLAAGISLVLFGTYTLWVWWPACAVAVDMQRARQEMSVGNLAETHRELETATRADPLSPVAANFNGRLYLQQSEEATDGQTALLNSAIRCFQEAITRNPASYKDYEKLALAYSRLGRQSEAYEWYLKAAGLYPGCERIWFELGQTAEKMGKPGLALCHYTKAVEIEDAYREQFRRMYPHRDKIVSRLGNEEYRLARRRIEELSK